MRKVALLAGVENYNDRLITPLSYAGDDALALGKCLKDVCGFDKVVTLAQRDGYGRPNCLHITTALDELAAELSPDDLFLFYFSGHGIEHNDRAYLLTEESSQARPYLNSLSREVLTDTLGHIEARWRVLLFDTCRNSPDSAKGDGANLMTEAVARETMAMARETCAAGATTAFYSACSQGKRAYEWPNWKQGVFTHFLLEGISGHAWQQEQLEFRQLVNYTTRNVREWTRKMPGFREPQEPWYEEFGAGERIVLAAQPGVSPHHAVEVAPGPFAYFGVTTAPPPPPMTGCLQVSVNVAGAEIWIDGRRVGAGGPQQPLNLRDIAVGSVEVEVRAPDYVPQRRETVIRGNSWTQEPFVLARRILEPGEAGTFAGIEMVWCPPGEFLMGSPESEAERFYDENQHRVTITRGFWLGKYPVTQWQWEAVMGNNPSLFKGEVRLPVEQVSWNDCQEFIRRLNAAGEGTFRLPTEAEWEYACRAGTATPFHFGETISTGLANYDGNRPYANEPKEVYREKTTVVGCFLANPWGLHDMHGNVWEWCADWYGDYPLGAVTDPTGPSSGNCRVLRGGSHAYSATCCRSANRCNFSPHGYDIECGFRVLRTP